MKHLITSGAIAAGLLFSLGMSTPLSAQAKPRATARMAQSQDTSCVPQARPLGDSTRSGQARQDCLAQKHVAVQADTTCKGMTSNRSTYASNVRSGKSDSLAPDKDAGTLRPACPEGMGAGVGTDSTKWPAKPDTARTGKP